MYFSLPMVTSDVASKKYEKYSNFYIQNFIIILSNVFIPQNEVICHKEIVRSDFMRIWKLNSIINRVKNLESLSLSKI